ncbi:hypothetical protein ACFPTX_00930 [Pseudomonas sp. GCM10022188]|uniref:hypothetical protein n=1 Tax=Pseudomonas TaxID=286 RepID=UPI001E2FEFF8|nr:hypothetical protein [Pseudomonas oryzagri]MCC6075166.1 hypothetical protein [Pseudomonas oryzagri]
MARPFELLLVFAWAIAFAAAAAWSRLSTAPFPLPGFRQLAESEGLTVIYQVSAVVIAAGWLAFRPWHTREHLIVFQGIALALFAQGFLYIGVPFGLAFGFFAGIARSRTIKAITSELQRD